jgi:formate hydrogenlyase transcriptional activator
VETEGTTDEVKRLQRCINDLVSALALPAIWTGHDSSLVATTLIDVLVQMLRLDFAYVRVIDSTGGPPKEWIRSINGSHRDAQPRDIGRALEPYLTDDPTRTSVRIANPFAHDTTWITVFPLGLQERVGVFVAGSRRPDFPAETERLLLQVATNQAAIALQEARYVSQRRRTTEDLERRVGERTAELTAVNETLRQEIVERKRAEEELQQSEARFQEAIDTIPGLVWGALPDGHIDYFNQRWREYTGLTLKQAGGWGWQMAIHPDDVTGLVESWRTLLASGEPGEMEARIRRFDGEYRWFSHRAAPLYDGAGKLVKWYGQTTDIDERKRAEERLRQDEQELRRTIDAIPALIHILGTDVKILYTNQSTLAYTGLNLEEAKADDFGVRIVHPDDLEKVRHNLQEGLAQGLPFQMECRTRRYDGQYRWFLTLYNPLHNEQGQILRWYAAASDINDRKQAEERVSKENLSLREEIDRSQMFEEIVGSSQVLRRVLALVKKVAPSDSTVLILGETGTGKELIARAVHKRSSRSSRTFVSVNCAATPAPLIASELFGHEKGAFTGAVQKRLGRFELANGGTLFLDEIGELPMETQLALLRVLQERKFERVGGSLSISVDVRIVAATNRDLKAAVASGAFREDLFYRLNVFPIQIPSLRERVDDIPLLVEYLIDRYAKKAGKNIRNIEKKTLELFKAYSWPGNIREMQNVVERAVILCDGETFSVDATWLTHESPRESSSALGIPLTGLLRLDENQEREMIETALAECGGRVSGPSGAATRLGIPRQTLESKITNLGINKHRFKSVQPLS